MPTAGTGGGDRAAVVEYGWAGKWLPVSWEGLWAGKVHGM